MLTWLAAFALAREPTPTPAADIEVIVLAEQGEATARRAVVDKVKSKGYFRLPKIGRRALYLHPNVLEPWVTLFDEGFMRVRGRQVVVVPVPAPGGVTVFGGFQSGGTARQQEGRLVRELQPLVTAWADARWATARVHRELAVREALHDVWDAEQPPEQRRALIARMWLDTADNDAGQAIRDVIAAFVDGVVQPTEPFLPSEIHDLNAERPWPEPFLPAGFEPY